MSTRSPGFSLIEILVVITIIGILIAISGGAYRIYVVHAEQDKTKTLIMELKTYAWDYNDRRGDFPPSSLRELGVSSTGSEDNEGIEAFTTALFQKDYEGSRPDGTSDLINADGDAADKNITCFEKKDLFEFADTWGNPLVYIRHTDYGKIFTCSVQGDAGWESEEVHALKDPKTGGWYNFDSFQLISLGPDGRFDTEDDVANFDRSD